jgi:hypothetical protein
MPTTNPDGYDGSAGDFVNSEAAAAVLWVLGNHDVGVEPGSFMTYLLKAWMAADRRNRALLGSLYTEHDLAFTVFDQHGEAALVSAAQRPQRARAAKGDARGDQG